MYLLIFLWKSNKNKKDIISNSSSIIFWKSIWWYFLKKLGKICKSIIPFVWSPSNSFSLTIMAPSVMFQSAIIRTAVTALLWFHTRAEMIQIFLFMYKVYLCVNILCKNVLNSIFSFEKCIFGKKIWIFTSFREFWEFWSNCIQKIEYLWRKNWK